MHGRLLKKQRLDFKYGDCLAAGDMDGERGMRSYMPIGLNQSYGHPNLVRY